MWYLGGGIGHHTLATDPASKEIPVTEGLGDSASDLEMDIDVVTNEDTNHTQGPQMDNIENPTEDDYNEDDVARSEVGVQDDELQDYKYTQGAEPEMDPEIEGLVDIDGDDLGPEDGEDDEYFHSDLEYD